MTYCSMSLNPYEPPQTSNDEPIVDLSPADALAKHQEEFGRELARQRLTIRLVGILLAVAMALLMLWPLLLR
jgi:hypothetical protein